MTAYTYSRVPTANFNTTPASIARSATGSVYDIADTGFTTPLNMTLVVGGAVVTTISSDALGFLPDFTLDGRVNCVWKQSGASFATVLTTSDPIPGPASTVAGPPGPPGPATTDASLLTAGTVADARLPTRLQDTSLNATYAQQWKANTAYTAGQPVVNPSGDVVTAKTAFTSGTSYSAANWNLSPSYTTPAQAAGLSAALSIVFGG